MENVDRNEAQPDVNGAEPGMNGAQPDRNEAGRKIDAIGKHVERSNVENGVSEIANGVQLAWMGLFFLVQAMVTGSAGFMVSRTDPVFESAGWYIGFAAWCLGGYLPARWLARRLKRQLIEPRAGMVVPRRPKLSAKQWIRVSVAGGLAGLVFVAPVNYVLLETKQIESGANAGTTTMLLAAVFGLLLFFGALRFRLRRFFVLAALSLCLGYAMVFLCMGNGFSLAAYCFFIGVATTVSGGLALRAFVRQNPLAETPTENRP